jgi:release factor glutamine methyltransferase
LAAEGVDSAALDARLLLADASGLDQAALVARGTEALDEVAKARFHSHIGRRLAGEPIARILAAKEFWGLSFALNEATLVPRPETELLVEVALKAAFEQFGGRALSICDLGAGSGAIVIALLSELPHARAVATDISAAALAMARTNAERHGVADRITFVEASFDDGPVGCFDLVLSNPPYVRSDDIAGLDREVREHDPVLALDGGGDGLAAYRQILARAPALLACGGMLIFEVGDRQSERVADLCRVAGLSDIAVSRDLAGIARAVAARRPAATAKKGLGKDPATG